MPTVKEQLLEIAEELPDDATYEDALKAVYFRIKAERGSFQFEPRKSVYHEEMARMAKSWEGKTQKKKH